MVNVAPTSLRLHGPMHRTQRLRIQKGCFSQLKSNFNAIAFKPVC